jgi:ADP-heptose:LPS heptosyltransferase
MKLIRSKKLSSRFTKIKKRKTDYTLREFYEKRGTVLIFRAVGGLGDILVHRMIFEDIKALIPDGNLVFACPRKFHEAVRDHPCIDELVDSETVDTNQYIIMHNTSNACCRYEVTISPLSDKNRSDIWANHCGVRLKHHNMHIKLEDEIIEETKQEIEAVRNSDGPRVLFTPISAMYNKNLTKSQVTEVISGLRRRGLFVYSSHTIPIPALERLQVPVLSSSIRKWMGYVYNADYVVTVDTSTFHMAGGIGKPQTAVFAFTDGKVYGRYYKNWTLVQKHRDDGNWPCGPCYNWPDCPKTKNNPKPCLLEITPTMILAGIDKMLKSHPIK